MNCGKRDEPMQTHSLCKSFFLNETYLLSSSKYFRTLLETAVGGLETEMSNVGRLRTIVILHDYIEEGEMEAMELALKSFYALEGPLPSDLIPSEVDIRVPLLLKALMIAERYQADRCKEKIAQALNAIPSTDLSYAAVTHLFRFPAGLYDTPLLSEFRSAVIDCMYQRFGDLPLVITTDNLRDDFFRLPFHAVLSLIKRDDLKVHSENDVVFLLNMWIEKVMSHSVDIDALIDAFIREIRVIYLGPAYLHSILPNLKWFNKSPLRCHVNVAFIARDHKFTTQRFKHYYPGLPPSWLSAPRKAPGYTPPCSTDCTWILDEDKLKELYDGKDVSSQPVYRNGHWVKVTIKRSELTERANNYALFVGWRIDEPFSTSHYFARINSVMLIARDGDPPVMRFFPRLCLTSDGILRGLYDFFDRQCPTLQEVIAPYLVDGKLTIKFQVSNVDETSVIT